jgi:hypothetical protein|tara:strand:- start:56 stop:349 length:294 start_codon:yes stop_codon:yes gene_type:complete
MPRGYKEWAKRPLMGMMYSLIVNFLDILVRLRCLIITWVELIILPIFAIIGDLLKFNIKPYTIRGIPNGALDPLENISGIFGTHRNHRPADSVNPVG